MIRRLVALVLAVLLTLPPALVAKGRNPVQALQSKGQTFCTAFSINETEGLWATAAHCAVVALTKQLDVTIDGQQAWVVYVGFPAVDIAVFQSDAHATAFALADV